MANPEPIGTVGLRPLDESQQARGIPRNHQLDETPVADLRDPGPIAAALAAKHTDDREAYTAAKSDFIRTVLARST
jgi:hypothetical protein